MAGFRIVCVLLLVALQYGLSLLYVRRAVYFFHHGEISALGLLLGGASLLLLGIAGLLLLGKFRSTAYVFGISALLGMLAWSQWQFMLVATCTGIAALACVVSRGLVRSPAKA